MSVPNLDAMSQSELVEFWSKHTRPKRKDAKALVGERKGYMSMTEWLAAYAINKSTAMSCRLRGDIQAAEIYEIICENIYKRLPADLRW